MCCIALHCMASRVQFHRVLSCNTVTHLTSLTDNRNFRPKRFSAKLTAFCSWLFEEEKTSCLTKGCGRTLLYACCHLMLVSLRWTPDMIRNTQPYFLYFLHRYVDMFSFYSSHLTHFSWRRASFLDASFISVNHPLSMSRLAFSLCCLLVSMKKCESQKNVKVKYFWNLSHPILSLWVSADSVKAMFSFFIFLYF